MKPGIGMSQTEIAKITADGLHRAVRGGKYFLFYEEFPWFRQAAVQDLLDARLIAPRHLRRPAHDIRPRAGIDSKPGKVSARLE